ncbi:MAG: O-methyltransferase [Mycobacteriaceae bacterium]|uniref:O-methyltransferase n=1 Tax=Corynebacterium sp. TaxID=1720 RepID=UPI003F994660
MSHTQSKRAPSPLDDTAREVADRLHGKSRRQLVGSIVPVIRERIRSRIKDGTWDPTQTDTGKELLADKMVALDPEKAALCHLLCRSTGARRVVEIGTSYGVSTIYLADAVRKAADADNAEGTVVCEGTVIGTEHEAGKVAEARRNLADAGLGDYAEILEGDLRETLPDRLAALDGPVDFVLMDIWIPMALPALDIITPHLRPGALVVCDNVVAAAKDYADYLEMVRDSGAFESVTIPGQGGTEISMKV